MAEEKKSKIETGKSGSDKSEKSSEKDEKEGKHTESEVGEKVTDSTPPLIENLFILPPELLNSKNDSNEEDLYDEKTLMLKLPPLRQDEPISSIKAVLCEVVGYAHLTNYRLVLRNEALVELSSDDQRESLTISKRDAFIIYPFTYRGIILPTDSNEDEIVLDEFSDLSSYLNYINDGYRCIRVVLEPYNLSKVKDQILRVRSLLDGNCPNVVNLMESDNRTEKNEVKVPNDKELPNMKENGKHERKERKNGKSGHGKAKNGKNKEETKNNDRGKNGDKSKNDTAAELLKEISNQLPNYPLNQPLTMNYRNLEYFYALACSDGLALEKEKEEELRGYLKEMKALDTACQLLNKVSINHSRYHPPANQRRILANELAYLEIKLNLEKEETLCYHVTAVPSGFYINQSTNNIFDPRPRSDGKNGSICFSHSLLDCILLSSTSFQLLWKNALEASRKRSELNSLTTSTDTPLFALYRIIKRAFSNKESMLLDSIMLRPCWIVPNASLHLSSKSSRQQSALEDDFCAYNQSDFQLQQLQAQHLQQQQSHSVISNELNIRSWNEEIQSAREMPTTTLQERIDRARIVHKIQVDFTDAALFGVKYIHDGFIIPMNPSEHVKSHVYLHNNIFFSRAVDAGVAVDTFKVAKGDAAAKKSASRDLNCIGFVHKLDKIVNARSSSEEKEEKEILYTLLTVLVDYLGTRYVCQSIVPGILHGEKTHELLHGAVETSTPLKSDGGFSKLLNETLGKNCRMANRSYPTFPLEQQTICDIELVELTVPLEAKGIQGSDKRKYILDLTRITPRDANWVPRTDGGTGNWEDEEMKRSQKKKSTKDSYIPKELFDDEWTVAVLRPELIAFVTQKKMAQFLANSSNEKEKNKNIINEVKNQESNESKQTEKAKDLSVSNNGEKAEEESSASKEVERVENASDSKKDADETLAKTDNKSSPTLPSLTPEQEEYLESLKYNVNVFLPYTKAPESFLSASELKRHLHDEEVVRDAANILWKEVLPALTNEIRDHHLSVSPSSMPLDGNSLKELLHNRGINLRYLGRLAQLAHATEELDTLQNEEFQKTGPSQMKPRRKSMPFAWLEILEIEMIARATKHVMDSYFMEAESGKNLNHPAQIVASILCALVSTKEESAADTEKRTAKSEQSTIENEGEFSSLPIMAHLPSKVKIISRDRSEIWNDISNEIGRRFRYKLVIFNSLKTDRSTTLLLPLLRRVCQKCGIRIALKNYDLGGKSFCGTTLTSSYNEKVFVSSSTYPISASDVIDILPSVKHSGAVSPSNGFIPCSFTSSAPVTTNLHILLPDAKNVQDAAHIHYKSKLLSKALDFAQDAASLYQRVVDSALHLNIAQCLDLTAIILFQAQELELATSNASRSLALYVQLFGLDCMEVVTSHTTLAHIYITSGDISKGIQHLRSAIYLMQFMSGPRYLDIASLNHKLGTLYHEVGNGVQALRFYQEAASCNSGAGGSCDKMLASMIAKSSAMVFAALGQYKTALEYEKRAYTIYNYLFGENHELALSSTNSLRQFMKLAVEEETRIIAEQSQKKKQIESKTKEESTDQLATSATEDELEDSNLDIGTKVKKKQKKKRSKKKN